jgi:hypothetical protein
LFWGVSQIIEFVKMATLQPPPSMFDWAMEQPKYNYYMHFANLGVPSVRCKIRVWLKGDKKGAVEYYMCGPSVDLALKSTWVKIYYHPLTNPNYKYDDFIWDVVAVDDSPIERTEKSKIVIGHPKLVLDDDDRL